MIRRDVTETEPRRAVHPKHAAPPPPPPPGLSHAPSAASSELSGPETSIPPTPPGEGSNVFLPGWIDDLAATWRNAATSEAELKFLTDKIDEVKAAIEGARLDARQIHEATLREAQRSSLQASHAAYAAEKAAAVLEEQAKVSAAQASSARSAEEDRKSVV